MVLWFSGFITVGGEWFLMWQSEIWNGQEAAFRLVVIFGARFLVMDPPGFGVLDPPCMGDRRSRGWGFLRVLFL
jgi:hypothetical protein